MVACQPVHLPRVVSPLRTTVQTKSSTGRLPQAVFFSTEQPKQAELLQSESRCRISITLNLNNHSHAPKTTGAYMMEIHSCRCRPNSGTVQPAVRHGGGFGLLAMVGCLMKKLDMVLDHGIARKSGGECGFSGKNVIWRPAGRCRGACLPEFWPFQRTGRLRRA